MKPMGHHYGHKTAKYSLIFLRRLSSRTPKTIFSGIQPTGIPHIGNYLGAIQNWVTLQNSGHYNRVIFSIVDLHAITVPQDPKELVKGRQDMLMALLACGIDPKKSVIFEQSSIKEHSELGWILNCLTPVGWLNRMTQWKSKIANLRNVNSLTEVNESSGLCLGLYAYPVLQAADILLYKANEVPIGEDQLQHLDLSRMIARQFNKKYKKNLFIPPQPLITPTKRIKSLRDPLTKMSKSARDPGSRILISDLPEMIQKKLKSAITDGERTITYDPENRPGIANLLSILAGLEGRTPEEVAREYEHVDGHAKLKSLVADKIIAHLNPIRKEYERLQRDGDSFVKDILKSGTDQARAIASKTMAEVKIAVGIN